MAIIILLLIIYVVPATITYFGIRRQYKREWAMLRPGMLDVLFVFVPLLNVGYAIYVVIEVFAHVLDEISDAVFDIGRGKKTQKFFAIKDDEKRWQ